MTRRHLWGAAHPHWAQGCKPGVARSVEGKCRGQDRSAGGSVCAPLRMGIPLCPWLFVQGEILPRIWGSGPLIRRLSCPDPAPSPITSRETQLGRLSFGIHYHVLCHLPCSGPAEESLKQRNPPKVTKLENRPTFLVWGRWGALNPPTFLCPAIPGRVWYPNSPKAS